MVPFSVKNIAQIEERKQPKIKTKMHGKGLTMQAGLLLVLTELTQKVSTGLCSCILSKP